MYKIKTNYLDNLDNSDDLDKLERELEMIIHNIPIITIELSKEQNKIIQIPSSMNIQVDAVAGSGKTTTILHWAYLNPNKKILLITYNNMLKKNVSKKINMMCLKNIQSLTYHGLGVKYYSPQAYTDEELKKILTKNLTIKILDNEKIDCLMIDEAQDMCFDYYKLIKKFISDTKSNPQIIILGDKYQEIYGFKGSNSKFLTLCDKIWNNNINNFVKLTLHTSYRLTNEIAWFVNNIMLGYNRINTVKSGPIVDYLISNPYTIYKKIGLQIVKWIKNKIINPSDIYVLVPSLKTTNAPYKLLENYLVKKGIQCYTPISDDSKLDTQIISSKVIFTTIFQIKGCENKVVIMYNFDSSYIEYFTKEKLDANICPNVLYVGATRASWKLILIQDFKSKPLSFINMNLLKSSYAKKYIKIYDESKDNILTNLIIINSKYENKIKRINCTDLVKFITPKSFELIINLLDELFIEIIKGEELVNITNKIQISSNSTWEDVSELNGLVIPTIYESKLINNQNLPIQTLTTIEQYVQSNIEEKLLVWDDFNKFVGKIPIPCKSINNFLKIGNIYLSMQNKLLAKLAQIKKYDWLDLKEVKRSHKFMDRAGINSQTKFEVVLTNPITSSYTDWVDIVHNTCGLIRIKGRLDAISLSTVWEFKCVDCLTIEHKLQLVIYYWLWNKCEMANKYGTKKFCLLNIKSGQILQLDLTKLYQIEQIVDILISDKYSNKKILSDDEFISICNEK